MNEKQKKQITLLIKEFSRNRKTSSLLSFVAESNGMLQACRGMVEEFDVGNPDIDQWLTSECRNIGIAEHAILKEIRDILKLFTPDQPMEEPYALLGVSVDASREEIKRAYRQLSLAHHPDTADQSTDYNPDKFIQITRAYHALINPGQNSDRRTLRRPKPVWKQERRRVVPVEQRKKVFLWITGILIALLVATLLFAINYRKRTMIAGLQHSQGAFIPPKAKRTVSLSAPYLLEGRADNQKYKDGSESLPKVDNAISVNENSILPVQEAEDPQEKMSVLAGTKLYSGKQSDSSGTGSNRAQSNDAEIRIDENIVTLMQNKNLKRLVEPVGLDSSQPRPVMLQPEVASNPDGELDNASYRDRGMGQNEEPVSNRQIRTQQVAEEHEDKQLQGVDVDDVINQQSLPVINRTDTAEITSNIPWDENAVVGPEELVLKTAAVEEENNLAPSLQDKPIPFSQALDDQVGSQTLQQRVDHFFLGYIDSYSQRNIRIFTNYFNDDAVENGKPFGKMQSIYDELFEATKTVTLQINDRELRQERENIVVDGTFEVFLQYKDNRKISGSGPITFMLVDRGNRLKIKSLSYKFN